MIPSVMYHSRPHTHSIPYYYSNLPCWTFITIVSSVMCVICLQHIQRDYMYGERCVKSLSFWDTPKALLPLTFFCCFWKCQRKFLLLEYFWVLKSGWQSDENICEVRSCEGWKLSWQFLWISMRENLFVTINKVAHTTRALRT